MQQINAICLCTHGLIFIHGSPECNLCTVSKHASGVCLSGNCSSEGRFSSPIKWRLF